MCARQFIAVGLIVDTTVASNNVRWWDNTVNISMAFRLSSAAAERCSGSILPSARPAVFRAGQSVVGARFNLRVANRHTYVNRQRQPLLMQSATLPLAYPLPEHSTQTPVPFSDSPEHLPILKTFAVVAACFAVCSFVSAAFPTAGPCLATISITAAEAAKGSYSRCGTNDTFMRSRKPSGRPPTS
jgi:hypothetical protein